MCLRLLILTLDDSCKWLLQSYKQCHLFSIFCKNITSHGEISSLEVDKIWQQKEHPVIENLPEYTVPPQREGGKWTCIDFHAFLQLYKVSLVRYKVCHIFTISVMEICVDIKSWKLSDDYNQLVNHTNACTYILREINKIYIIWTIFIT